MRGMEVECSRCHRKFQAQREGVDVCPACLEREFSTAGEVAEDTLSARVVRQPPQAIASSALEREFVKADAMPLEEEDAALSKELRMARFRQKARADRLRRDLGEEGAFSSAGKVRFLFGILVFGTGAFAFFLGSGAEYQTFISELPKSGQYVLAGLVAVISCVLVVSSTHKYPAIRIPLAVALLAGGCFLPLLSYEMEKTSDRVSLADDGDHAGQSGIARKLQIESEKRARMGMNVLSKEDLAILRQTRKDEPGLQHIAVFMDEQQQMTGDMLRDELSRLLQARQTRAYAVGTGYLYIVSGASCSSARVSEILSRFGVLTYTSTEGDIYELSFDAEKACMKNPYSGVTLTTVYDPSFVAANLYELRCPDSKRVARSAQILADANVKLLRRDIYATVVRVLDDPWGDDDEAYTQLMRALCVYAEPGDKQAAQRCMLYFRRMCTAGRSIPEQVVEVLVRELPDEMAVPIARLWAANPVAWENSLTKLATRAEPVLLDFLKRAESISQINALLRFFQRNGTTQAIPHIQKLLDHDDAVVRHSARSAIEKIRQRATQEP